VASKFTDCEGEEWQVAVKVRHLPALKEVGFDPDQLFDEKDGLAARIGTDPGLIVRAIYVLCEKQVQDRNLSPEAFADRFDGETYGRAVEALTAEVAAFFRISAAGRVLSRNVPATFAAMERAAEAALKERLESVSSGFVGNSPATSAPTPAN
jgi:hypothetical protein